MRKNNFYLSALALILGGVISLPFNSAAQSSFEGELWEERAAQDFKEVYPDLKSSYEEQNGMLNDRELKSFKEDAWKYFWNQRREEIDSILDQDFGAEDLVYDVKSVSVSSKVRNRILKSGVPKKAFNKALKRMGDRKVKKKDRMVIIDFSKKATQKRFYFINLKRGNVETHRVSHGVNSGGFGARATSFSNKSGSKKTPPGFFVTGGRTTYKKKWGSKALILDGIDRGNRNSRAREIVSHGAGYVNGGGRSHGCPALDVKVAKRLFPKLSNGVLWYHYTGK